MIVEYATWELDAPDPEAYEAWHGPILEQCRAEKGCLAYDHRVDPKDPTRHSLFQAWESREAFDAHIEFPPHKELLVPGKPWRTLNVTIQRWDDADGYHEVTVEDAKRRAGIESAPAS